MVFLKSISSYWSDDSPKLYQEDVVRPMFISGYIRQIMIILSFEEQYLPFKNIPSEIIDFVSQYHAQIIVGFTIFNNQLTSIDSKCTIKSSIKKNKQRMLISNIGFSKGINKWTIRCKSSLMYLIIGVIANPTKNEINRIKTKRPWVYDDKLTITKYFDAREVFKKHRLGKTNMDIAVTLNCNENLISFECKYIDENTKKYSESVLNKKHTIKLRSHYTWYPILGFYYFDEEFKSIRCECLK